MTNTPDPDTATLSEEELQLLGKLDERTERIDGKVDDVIEETEANRKRTRQNGKKIKRNTTILGGYSAGLMSVLIWFADKVTRVL